MAQNGARDYTFGTLFGTTWVILGAILGPAGRQGAPKIDLLGTKSHQNLKEKNYREKRSIPYSDCEPFWAQLGAKGLPKSSFLAPSRTKISKNEAQNEASKNI